MLQRLNDEVNQLRTQLDAMNSECNKREGKLSAIGRLVQPLAGETLVNAVVRRMDLLNQLLAAIQSEGDPVATVKALRAQRDQLRTEVQHLKDEIAGGGVVQPEAREILVEFSSGRRDWVTHIRHCDYKVVRTGEVVRRSQFTLVPQAAA